MKKPNSFRYLVICSGHKQVMTLDRRRRRNMITGSYDANWISSNKKEQIAQAKMCDCAIIVRVTELK